MSGELAQRHTDEDETSDYRAVEFRRVTRTLEALYARLRADGGSVLLRQHARRLEALQQALMGFAAALAK
ncbi:hypothetical protein ACH4TE_17540 [Streptomyces sioyaensis]|uniref:hypothetical protein n=1 Tax=Streptomyces sioyaensis TaxID=67364 RepID=UPI00378BD2A2